jgi:HSP20 family protein
LQQNGLRRAGTVNRWQPAVDIIETAQHYEIQLDLPGVKADQVQVELEDNTLKISGEKVRPQNENETYRYKERVTGTFARQFRLPEDANLNAINARFDNGVLSLTIQKQEQAKPRKIEIQSA